MREWIIHGCPYWGVWGMGGGGGGSPTAENLHLLPRIFQNWNSKVNSLSVLNTKYIITSFLRQFLENCKDEIDMGRLEVVMHSEIQFFSSLPLYTFLWG